MTRVLVLGGLATWVGMTLVLSELRWFRTVPLPERLGPHTRGGQRRGGRRTAPTVLALVEPLAASFGARLGRVLGVRDDLDRRLERIHSPLDVADFRVRQLGQALAALGVGALALVALRPPLPVVVLVAVGGPLLTWLVVEQRVVAASERWQRRVLLELPVVAEQLATLVNAGWSLLGALDRVSRRGRGACASDLRQVVGRVGQGLTEGAALREWADVVAVAQVDRLVGVLELNRHTTDLGRLLTVEARAVRRDVHRELLETMERRSQQVWIPVTVATLLPGVVFIAIPFVTALRAFVTT